MQVHSTTGLHHKLGNMLSLILSPFSFSKLAHGDYNPAVHQPEFLKGQLENLLPQSIISSRKRADIEKRVRSRHQEISKQEYDVVKVKMTIFELITL